MRIFMETWGMTLHRSVVSGVLDELRTALLLGKEVRICMPQKQMETFRNVATAEEIERVVGRIDINHASATFPKDRINVLQVVEDSVGTDALNGFCREIVFAALMEAAGPRLQDVQRTNSRRERTEHILENLLTKADLLAKRRMAPDFLNSEGLQGACTSSHDDASNTPKEIEIRRAVGLMQARLDTDTAGAAGLVQLEHSRDLARRFYGEGAQVLADIERCILRIEVSVSLN